LGIAVSWAWHERYTPISMTILSLTTLLRAITVLQLRQLIVIIGGICVVSYSAVVNSDALWIPPFAQAPGDIAAPWEPLRLPKHIARASTSVTLDDGQLILEIQANKQAGGAFLRLTNVPTNAKLTWDWRTSRVLSSADLTQKAADDFAARVYVMFDYPVERLPYLDRLRAKLARTFYDPELPLATLCYVWDNRHPRDTMVPSVYTDRVRLIVLRNHLDNAGRWLSEIRNLGADFRRAFGEDPPPIVGLAFAADTDNTGEQINTSFRAPRLSLP
jgi:hypothetical protein